MKVNGKEVETANIQFGIDDVLAILNKVIQDDDRQLVMSILSWSIDRWCTQRDLSPIAVCAEIASNIDMCRAMLKRTEEDIEKIMAHLNTADEQEVEDFLTQLLKEAEEGNIDDDDD